MMKSTQHEREADRVAAQTVNRFPDWLRTETEDRQYKILAQMLSGELEKIKLKARR